MDTPRKLIKALNKSTLEFPEISKDNAGQKGAGKYNYAKLEDILDVVQPVLARNGVAVNFYKKTSPEGHEILQCVLEHEDTGETRVSECFLNPKTPDEKDWGSNSTYKARYLIAKMLALKLWDPADTDDFEPVSKPYTPSFTSKPTYNQVTIQSGEKIDVDTAAELLETLSDAEIKQICSFNKVAKIEDLTVTQYNNYKKYKK